ncbi:MAG: type II toxin-antitoxin system VapC family toxin [Isosphaeraceae bacterium]
MAGAELLTLPSHALVLLDTSVLVHLARQDTTGVWIENQFALSARADRPLISTVTEGEILGLARQRNWGDTKVAALTRLLAEIVRVEAGLPEVVDAYADLTVLDVRGGHNTKDNDLWIAATAKATGAVLLT